MKILFIADFFIEDVPGGGEKCSEEVIAFFKTKGYEIQRIHSHLVNTSLIKNYQNDIVFISNFINLQNSIKDYLIQSKVKYYIFEHDHKYNKARNPLAYYGMIVPEDELLYKTFYENAMAVFCQSKAHAEVLSKNVWIDNVVNLGCNLWSKTDLQVLQEKLSNVTKTRKIGIMQSPNKIKGTNEAIELCKSKGLSYELIPPKPQHEFWDELVKTETIVFLPQTYETYSRFAIEAKILGCKMITNKAIGAMSEDYWNQNGQELLDTIKKKKNEVLALIEDIVLSKRKYWSPSKPVVSVVTTVYKGAKYMKGFLDAFVEQINNKNHELIIIDANSPEDEYQIAKPYLEKNSNILYVRLEEKATTAKAFNLATDMAKGDFIAMCMVDDRLAPFHLDLLSKQLFLRTDVDLVYGDTYIVSKENPQWNIDTGPLLDHSKNDFSKEGMIKNLPGPMPLYRKELHYKIGGYQEEILHGTDWEFYLRAVKNGSRFLKINKSVGLYYNNPLGLSTSKDQEMTKERRKSERRIFEQYKDVFGEAVYRQFKPYFDQFC